MNRFQRQLEIAMQAINEMQDEHRYVAVEKANLQAEVKRLRFAQYGTMLDGRFTEHLTQVCKPATVRLWCDDDPSYDTDEVIDSADESPRLTKCVRLDCIAEDIRELPRAIVYFDVVNWLWTAIVDVRV